MTTIDNIMKLADEYKDAAESQTYMDQSGSMYQWKVAKEKAEESREALRTALTEALAAPPVREPLNKGEWPKHPSAYVNDEYIGYSKSDLTSYAMQVLQAHGIGGDKAQPAHAEPAGPEDMAIYRGIVSNYFSGLKP